MFPVPLLVVIHFVMKPSEKTPSTINAPLLKFGLKRKPGFYQDGVFNVGKWG